MITILFPEDDYQAAEIAVKTEALVERNDLYIVPKYPWRKEDLVWENLDKTDMALFIAFASKGLDKRTSRELEYLLNKQVPVYALLPAHFPKLPFDNIHQIRFQTKRELVENLEKLILKKEKASPKKKETNDLLDFLFTLGLLIGGMYLLKKLSDMKE